MKREIKALCRVCLQCDLDIEGAGASSIFDKSDKCFIFEKLNNIAEVNIKPKDGLPDKICAECLLELENAINFKQKCETSNSILLSAASAGDGLKDEEALEVNVKDEPDEYMEEPESPPEVTLKSEETDDQEQSLSSPEVTLKPEETEDQKQSPSSPEVTLKPEDIDDHKQQDLHLEPPFRPSRAIDLQLECHDCGILFKSKCKLKVHWFKVHLKTQLTCNICGRTFASFKNLKDHKLNRTKRCLTLEQVHIEGKGKSRVYNCKECVYSTKYVETMAKHLSVHSGERDYACTMCPATYIYLNSLDAHMESKHGVIRKSNVCNICGKTLGHRAFYSHMRKHKGNSVKCNVCNKVFKYKSYLKIHMERHEGIKKYACDKCGKSFTTANSLYHHRRLTHGDKSLIYNCNICEFTINNRKTMDKHKLKHSKYDYVCTTCGKFFENATQLSCHEEKHENNYACQHCERTFYNRKLLLKHMNKMHNVYISKTVNKVGIPK